MKLDAGLQGPGGFAPLSEAAALARKIEDAGYSGVITAETSQDPFLPLALAAAATERVELMTGIAVAFARNPMLLANTAWDLQTLSQGRFVLGLGSQIKPHITKRFSMPWSDPAARMQEMIEAIHAIWDCWQTGERLAFRGQYYRHTLMTPMFDPGPNEFGKPRITLAAVGPLMTKTAGRVADGMVCHAFQTEQYLRTVTMPNVMAGLVDADRERETFELSMPVFVVSSFDEDRAAQQARNIKKQIAFYGSTPAYRPVLDLHGWGDAQDDLNRLSKQGEWDEMANVIDDTMLDAFAIVAAPPDVPALVQRRYGDILDRMQFYARIDDGGDWAPILAALRAI